MKNFLLVLVCLISSLSILANSKGQRKAVNLINSIHNNQDYVQDLRKDEVKKLNKLLKRAENILFGYGDSSSNSGNNSRASSRMIILTIGNSIASQEHSSKAMETAIETSEKSVLMTLKNACAGTKTWRENKSCLISGIESVSNPYNVSEEKAKAMILIGCQKTKTWRDEASCFDNTAKFLKSDTFKILSNACSSNSGQESRAKCYRNALK